VKNLSVFLLNRHVWINPVYILHDSIVRLIYRSKKTRILFLDIDGVVWDDKGPGTIFMKPTINPSVRLAVQEARKNGYKVVLVSNQTFFCYQAKVKLKILLNYIWLVIRIVLQFRVTALLVCHHHPKSDFQPLRRECPRRKPLPGMLNALGVVLPFDLNASVFVGDRISDAACASLGGVKRIFLLQNPSMFEKNVHRPSELPEYLVFSLIPTNQLHWSLFC